MSNLNGKQMIISLPSSFLLFLLLLILSSSSSIISVSATETTTNSNLRKSSTTTLSSQDNRNLIIGGKDANVNTYPRSIVFLSDRLDDLSCGGTLISPTIVLAAAHCEISLVSDAVFQRYHHPSEVGINPSKEIRIPVKEEIKHPNYNRRTLENDVMLLILEKSPNDYVRNSKDNTTQQNVIPYMKLHQPSDPSLDELAELMRIVEKGDGNSRRKSRNNNNSNNNDNRLRLGYKLRSDATAEEGQSSSPNQTPLKLTALGWGHTVSGGKGQPSDTLQEARLNYVYNSECNKAQESNLVNYDGRISPDMMCTWHSQQDTCHGDSGGPIVLENLASILENANDNTDSSQRDQYIQVGIVSWGEDCADAIFPGVASRVSESYEWIRRRVCSIDGTSNQTPESFDCDELVTNTDTDTKLRSSTFSPAPSSSPSSMIDKFDAQTRTDAINLLNGDSDTSGSATTVDATVEIYLDVFAIEQGWKLVEVDTGIAVRNFPFGSYQFENFIKEEVQLTVGKTYNFTIYDQYGDGITNNGYYRIYYTADNNTEEQQQEPNQIDLVEKSEFSGREQSDKFTVSADSTSTSTSTSTSGWSLSSSQTTPATTAAITTQEIASQGRNEGRNKNEYRIGQISDQP